MIVIIGFIVVNPCRESKVELKEDEKLGLDFFYGRFVEKLIMVIRRKMNIKYDKWIMLLW